MHWCRHSNPQTYVVGCQNLYSRDVDDERWMAGNCLVQSYQPGRTVRKAAGVSGPSCALGPCRYISIHRHQQPAHGHQCEEKTPKKHDAMLSTAAVGVGVLNVPSEALCFQRTMSLVIPITAIVDLVLP